MKKIIHYILWGIVIVPFMMTCLVEFFTEDIHKIFKEINKKIIDWDEKFKDKQKSIL